MRNFFKTTGFGSVSLGIDLSRLPFGATVVATFVRKLETVELVDLSD